MTVSFVGAQGAAAATVTIPAHQVGDLILIFAYRDGSTIAPTAPTAGGTVPTWTLINSAGSNTNSSNFRYAVATSTTTTSGTWTNATEILCLVYRGASVGATATTSGASTTISYSAVTLQRQDNSSWVVGVAGHRTATNVEVAPSGMTNRISTGTEIAGHDSNGTLTGWTAQSVTVNANSGWRSSVIELRDKTIVLTADKGTYTLSGKDAGLAKGRNLVADKATFTISDIAADVRHTELLTANVGAFTVGGVDAGVRHNAVLIAVKGSIVISPVNTVVFRKTYNLVASTRAFNINGISANIIYTGGQAVAKALYYQSIDIDPRKSIVSPVVNEDQLVYYIKGFLRIL